MSCVIRFAVFPTFRSLFISAWSSLIGKSLSSSPKRPLNVCGRPQKGVRGCPGRGGGIASGHVAVVIWFQMNYSGSFRPMARFFVQTLGHGPMEHWFGPMGLPLAP